MGRPILNCLTASCSPNPYLTRQHSLPLLYPLSPWIWRGRGGRGRRMVEEGRMEGLKLWSCEFGLEPMQIQLYTPKIKLPRAVGSNFYSFWIVFKGNPMIPNITCMKQCRHDYSHTKGQVGAPAKAVEKVLLSYSCNLEFQKQGWVNMLSRLHTWNFWNAAFLKTGWIPIPKWGCTPTNLPALT